MTHVVARAHPSKLEAAVNREDGEARELYAHSHLHANIWLAAVSHMPAHIAFADNVASCLLPNSKKHGEDNVSGLETNR